jgi:hypothetical protein
MSCTERRVRWQGQWQQDGGGKTDSKLGSVEMRRHILTTTVMMMMMMITSFVYTRSVGNCLKYIFTSLFEVNLKASNINIIVVIIIIYDFFRKMFLSGLPEPSLCPATGQTVCASDS